MEWMKHKWRKGSKASGDVNHFPIVYAQIGRIIETGKAIAHQRN